MNIKILWSYFASIWSSTVWRQCYRPLCV